MVEKKWKNIDLKIIEHRGPKEPRLEINQRGESYFANGWGLTSQLIEFIDTGIEFGLDTLIRPHHPRPSNRVTGVDYIGLSRKEDSLWTVCIDQFSPKAATDDTKIIQVTFQKRFTELIEGQFLRANQQKGGGRNIFLDFPLFPDALKLIYEKAPATVVSNEPIRGNYLKSNAVISACRKYRYELTRTIGDSPRSCLFIMLNPSTANTDEDDATIRRCRGYAEDWGYGEFVVVNLFAFRSKSPTDMLKSMDPIGPENDIYLKKAIRKMIKQNADLGINPGDGIVCCWGSRGQFQGRGKRVLNMLKNEGVNPNCLKLTSSGEPAHLLYLAKDLVPRPMM